MCFASPPWKGRCGGLGDPELARPRAPHRHCEARHAPRQSSPLSLVKLLPLDCFALESEGFLGLPGLVELDGEIRQRRTQQGVILEQLRALSYGHRIFVADVDERSIEVDTPADLAKAEKYLGQQRN